MKNYTIKLEVIQWAAIFMYNCAVGESYREKVKQTNKQKESGLLGNVAPEEDASSIPSFTS